MGRIREFLYFPEKYKAFAVVAFTVAAVSTSLVKSLVECILVPSITPFVAENSRNITSLSLVPFSVNYCALPDWLTNSLITSFVVFIVSKKSLKPKKER